MVLESLTDEQLLAIIHALLAEGVPSTAIASAFDIDPDQISSLRSSILVRKYGTDEINEAMNNLMWKAYDHANKLLDEGSPTNKLRTITMILSRTVTSASRQPPRVLDDLREEVRSMVEESRDISEAEMAEPGKFVVTA